MNWLEQGERRRANAVTRLKIFCVLNLAVTIAALIFIVWAGTEAEKYFERGVLCVMPVVNDNAYYFGSEDLEAIAKADIKGMTASERLTNTVVVSGEIQVYSGVITTSRDYFDIYRMTFIDGEPWIRDQENERVIVLSESLAWMLFGNTKSAGLKVYLNNEAYTVTGVAAQGTVSKDAGFAWIPPDAGGEIYSNTLYIKPAHYNRLDAYLETEALLRDMNRQPRDYRIIDLNAYSDSIFLREQILMFLMGMYAIFIISVYLFRLSRYTFRVKKSWPALVICVPAVIAVIAITVDRTTLDLWIPAFAGEGLTACMSEFFNIGKLAERQYLSYNLSVIQRLNLYANIAFGAGFVGFAQFTFFTHFFIS